MFQIDTAQKVFDNLLAIQRAIGSEMFTNVAFEFKVPPSLPSDETSSVID